MLLKFPLLLLCALVLLALPRTASADTVTVKGTTLEGTVTAVTGKNVELKTIYGDGKLTIPIEDVQSIDTEGVFHVFHGEDVDTIGRIVGVEDEALLVAPSSGAPERIAIADVAAVRPELGDSATFIDDLGTELPYWSGHFDIGFNYQQATTDLLGLGIGLELKRELGPNRFKFGTTYRRGSEKKEGESQSVTANELRAVIRDEHDFAPRIFGFASLEGERDQIESLSIRAIPKLGVGYKLYTTEAFKLSVETGGAYVYERFFGGDTNDYFSVLLGAESDVKLPYGATWRSRVDYLPSVSDFVGDYILRGETGLLVPMSEHLSFKVSLVDVYDSTPAQDTTRNSFTTLVGLSVGL